MKERKFLPKRCSEKAMTRPLRAKKRSTAASPWLNRDWIIAGAMVRGRAWPSMT
jgi:hypothetical protein